MSKVESKIGVTRIIRDHFKSLVNQNTNRAGIDDWVAFLFLPLIIAGLLLLSGFKIDSNSVETVVASLAIFVGLLFNALVLLIDMPRKHPTDRMLKNIVKELTANISFSILVSILAIPVMLMGFVNELPNWIKIVINLISFFLLAEFILVFMMVLKRTYLIFSHDITKN